MFDLKREFEEQQNSSGFITYEYGLDPVSDFLLDGEIKDFEEGMKKLEVLNTVDAACLAFETALRSNDEVVSYESALETFSNVISQNGFTLEDFGFASEGLSKESAILTVESAEDVSMWKKVWNWIKEKAAALWEWIKEKWDLVTGKTAKLNKIADELEKQVEAIPEGGFGEKYDKESGLTHEGASKNKLYFKDIASIPGAGFLADIRAYGKDMAQTINNANLMESQDKVDRIVNKYLSGISDEKIKYTYNEFINDTINIFKSIKTQDPTIKNTDFKVGAGEFFASISHMTSTTVTYSFMKIKDGEHNSLMTAIDFSGKRVANIKANINPNKELQLLSKSEILEAIKNAKSNLKTIDSLMKEIDVSFAKKGPFRKESGNFIAKAPASEKNNVIDLIKYTIRSMQWFTSLRAQFHLGTESMLRVLAVHTKKHYVNQH